MKNDKLVKILENLGLSDNEARVYLASLTLGSTTIMKIAQTAEIKRTTVYSVIDSLKQKGLMKIEVKGFKQLYLAESPDTLEGMINSRRETLRSSLPEFMALYNLKGGESFIRYYEGIEAAKTIYSNILKEVKPGDYLLVVSDQETWYGQDPQFFQKYLEERARMNIKVRKLLQSTSTVKEHGWGTPTYNEEVKFLPQGTKLTTNLVVIPHKIVIHQITPPIIAIEIENPSAVQMMKEMFEIMWRSIR